MKHHDRHDGGHVDQTLVGLNMLPSLAPGAVTQFNWVGGSGGNGDWNTAKDWNPASVPGASATVTFATGDFGYTVTGDATVSAIFVNGDGVTFDGALTETSGGPADFLTATNFGQVTLDSNSFVSGGAIDFEDGTLLDVQGALITTGGTADVVIVEGLNGQMIDSGVLSVNQLYVQTGASFTGSVDINDGGNITLDSSASFGGGSVTLLGSGTIYVAAAPGETSGQAGIGDAIAVAAGGFLNLGADPGVTLAVSGPISGAGNVIIVGGTVEFTAANSYTGITDVMNGTLQVDAPGAVPSGLVFMQDAGFINAQSSSGNTDIGTLFADTIIASGTSDTVDAQAGGLLVFAGPTGTLDFVGGATTSIVIGGSGALSATGGAGGDLIFGGTSGADTIATGAGDSTIVGGAGALLEGNGGGDAVMIAGGDNVFFNASNDTGSVTLFGAAGDNASIGGGAGSLVAIMNDSNATLFGGSGAATVFSGSGGLALDYVNGLSGGTTDVVGFDASRDMINLFAYAPDAAQQALASETISGGNTMLKLADNTQIELIGVTNLTIGNFTSV
ncbi:MAG TPA: hypothetical protein VMB71_11895 [Acetobacteraceae bacterium]|nr:hypothetical protein [Acetobacteraceae bacterium]